MSDVTICVPVIPPRVNTTLPRALESVFRQEHGCDLAVAVDYDREGAWATRNRAASMAQTEWIGFLDDDDELLPHHVSTLLAAANGDYDMVWGWFEVQGGTDPFPHYRGRQYDPYHPHVVPITYLVKTELYMDTNGFRADEYGAWDLQDQPVLNEIIAAGGKMLAIWETTWIWHHHGANTSGLPSRWT